MEKNDIASNRHSSLLKTTRRLIAAANPEDVPLDVATGGEAAWSKLRMAFSSDELTIAAPRGGIERRYTPMGIRLPTAFTSYCKSSFYATFIRRTDFDGHRYQFKRIRFR